MREVALVVLWLVATTLAPKVVAAPNTFETGQPQPQTRSPDANLSPSATPVPGSPGFGDYGKVLTAVFHGAFEPTIQARMLAMPAFENEYVIALREDHGEFTILSEQAGKRLWNYELLTMFKKRSIIATTADGRGRNAEEIAALQADLPSDYRDVRMTRCEAKIDSVLAAKIISLWRLMLMRATPGGSDEGLDGEEYYFSTPDMAGTAWSPPSSSNDGMLVNIAGEMKRYCNQFSWFRPWHAASIRRQVDALQTRLKQ